MDKQLERFKAREYAIERDILEDLLLVKNLQEEFWRPMLDDLILAGELLAAGESNLLVETRRPVAQTADFASVALATTSKNILPQNGTGFMSPGSYWEVPKEWRFVLMAKFTTVLTPGNLTTELRYQNAVPLTDAGGTILATSPAVALTASKTNISFVMTGRIHSRGAIGATTPMFSWAFFMPDQSGLLIPAANNPQIIPVSAAAAVNCDTNLAGGYSVQMKRSGSTAEAVVVHDLSVEAVT